MSQLWASLRASSPPRPLSVNAVSPHPLASGGGTTPRHASSLHSPGNPNNNSPRTALSPVETAESELQRLISLSDVGSLLAERVTLRTRLRDVEMEHSKCGLVNAESARGEREKVEALAAAREENAALAQSLLATQRGVEKGAGVVASLQQQVERERERADAAERRVYQLQALMASQATAASSVLKDWAAGGGGGEGEAGRLLGGDPHSLHHARGQRLAFFNDHLAAAQARAEEAEARVQAVEAACAARLANETLGLRLQIEALESSASGRIASLQVQLGALQGECEEGGVKLGKCEEALRSALGRISDSVEQREEAYARIVALERELEALRGKVGEYGRELEALRAKAGEAEERHAGEMGALKVERDAKVRELEEKIRALQQQLVAARAAPAPPAAAAPVDTTPDEHDTLDNPLLPHILPDGDIIRSMSHFISYARSPSIGLTASQLIIFVDCTKSNEINVNKSFTLPGGGPRSLHDCSIPTDPNPYQRTISILGKSLEEFDDDKLVPLYGFGDRITKEKYVFPYDQYDRAREMEKTPELIKDLVCLPRCGIDAVLKLYGEVHGRPCDCKAGPFSKGEVVHVESCPRIKLQGGTSFAPAIRKAIELVKEDFEFTICLIIADGCVSANCLKESEDAVVEASNYPISIITIGVGDGEPPNANEPEKSEWHQMEECVPSLHLCLLYSRARSHSASPHNNTLPPRRLPFPTFLFPGSMQPLRCESSTTSTSCRTTTLSGSRISSRLPLTSASP